MKNEISNKVLNYIKEYNMITPGDKIAVALSGGADSVSLIHFICDNSDKLGIDKSDIVGIHVNHGIRGETADRDEEFAARVCNKLGTKFLSYNATKMGIKVPDNASEEWARNFRYGCFEAFHSENMDYNIVTAHTISDDVETLVFRLARGTGLKGLTGVPKKRDYILRPFLCITRCEVEELCKQYNTDFVTDETNLTDDYARNKIRHNIVPVLKELNDKAEQHIIEASQRIEAASNFINKYTKQKMKDAKHSSFSDVYLVDKFIGEDNVIIEEFAIEMLSKAGKVSKSLIEAFCNGMYHAIQVAKYDTVVDISNTEETITIIPVSDTCVIHISNKYVTLHRDNYDKQRVIGVDKCGRLLVDNNGETLDNFDMLTAVFITGDCLTKHNALHSIPLDIFEKMCKSGELYIRYGKSSEVFCPYNTSRPKRKLKKVMQGLKWPIMSRDKILVMEYKGQLLWVASEGFSSIIAEHSDFSKDRKYITVR